MQKIAQRTSAALFAILLVTVLVAGCATQAPLQTGSTSKPTAAAAPISGMPKSLIFGSQPIGTSTYVVGTGLATVIERYTGIKSIVQPMATSGVLYNEMHAGRIQLNLMTQRTSYLSFRGEGEFKDQGPRSAYQLAAGNANAYVWVTRPDLGIKTYQDMVGKKLAYITAVSQESTEIFRLALEYHGVADKVTALSRSSMAAAASALIEKKIDVIGGPYGPFGYELLQATGMVVIPLDPAAAKYAAEKRPDLCVITGVFKKGYYGLESDVETVAAVKEIVVSPKMTEDVAYAITKAIMDHPEDTKAIHADVGEFNLSNALAFEPFIPFHPGAIKYFKEKGVWTAKHEEKQQKLLALEKELAAKKKS